MSEIQFLQHAWKRALAFALALNVGIGLTVLIDFSRRLTNTGPDIKLTQVQQSPPAARVPPPPPPSVRREPPSIHVLSPMLMSEVQMMELLGEYESAQITSPAGLAYLPATRKDYKQGVLQVNFLFGTDGVIHEVVPVEKRIMCGPCLEGEKTIYSEKVVRINKTDPRFGEFVDAAAATLKRIEFIPARVAGHPYPTHGFAECVFRLD